MIHHNTDIWGEARPIDGIKVGIWPMGGAWLTLQAWELYAFSGDKAFLAERPGRCWRVVAVFSRLPDAGWEGHLVTGPSPLRRTSTSW